MGGTFLEGILALKRDDDLFEEYIFFFNFLIRCREIVFGYLTLVFANLLLMNPEAGIAGSIWGVIPTVPYFSSSLFFFFSFQNI